MVRELTAGASEGGLELIQRGLGVAHGLDAVAAEIVGGVFHFIAGFAKGGDGLANFRVLLGRRRGVGETEGWRWCRGLAITARVRI